MMTGPGSAGSDGRPRSIDTVVNLVGLGITGVSGVLLLGTIGAVYGAAELGRFNLVLAAYLISSQVATLAIHHGVLHHLGSVRTADSAKRRGVLLGALLAITSVATVVVIVLSAGAGPVLNMLGRADLTTGVRWGVLAAGAFAVNKVLLSALNALARFRAFALAGAARGVLLFVSGLTLALLGAPGASLPLLLLLAEASLTVILLILLRQDLRVGGGDATAITAWAGRFLHFGVRGFAGGFLSDLNTRVDVLCLSLFVDDRAIGIYSLAAVLAEAAHQVPIVIRSLLSARVISLLGTHDEEGLRGIRRMLQRRLQPVMLAGGLTAVVLYSHAVALLGNEGLAEGQLAFAVLMAGIVITSAYTPFTLLLVQGGDAIGNSLLLLSTVTFNIVGNLALIPLLGIEGAAVATAATTVVTVLLLRTFSRHRLGVRI